MTAVRILLARLRENRLPAVLLAALTFASALFAGAAPRLFNAAADTGLRHEVARAASVERNLELGRITAIEAAPGEALRPVGDVEASVEDALPASVRALVAGESYFAESIVWSVLDRPAARPAFVTLRAQALADEIRLVEGRMPTGTSRQVPAPEPPPSSVPLPPGERTGLLFEAALSTATARELDVAVGARMDLIPDTEDPLVGAFGFPEAAAVEVVGLYEVVDPASDFWVADTSLDRPSLVPVGLNTVLVYGTALLSPDAYPAMTQLSWPMRYTFRYYVDPDRLDAGMLDQLVVDLRRMEGQFPSFAATPDPTRTTLQTGLPSLLNTFRADQRAAQAVLATAAIGPAAVALVAIAVLAALAIARGRRSLVLMRGRGGTGAQLAGSHLLQGVLLTAAPAALAAWLAVRMVEARDTPLTPLLAGSVALATVVVLVAASVPAAFSSLRALERDAPPAGSAGPRRLALEALAVGLAIGGAVLLRQRGLAGGSAAGELAGVDPFLAAVPALVGLAVGLVAVRLYPYPVRAAGFLAGATRGLTPALGLRRAERQADGGHLPLVVLLLTVAIGTFSSTMLATIDRGQVESSWRAVGASHRVVLEGTTSASATIAAAEALAEAPGVEAVATAHEVEATVGIAGGTRVALVAIDAAEYESVTAGTPAETRFPSEFHAEVGGERPGQTTTPIPAIVSSELRQTSTTPFEVGDTFQLTVQARFATFVVSEVRRELPTLSADRAFIVVPRHLLVAGLTDRPLPPTGAFVRAPGASTEDLLAAATDAGARARVVSQSDELAAMRSRPLVGAVEGGFALGLALAVGYAALAITVSLILAGTARARETAHLRTLGIDHMQVLGLAVLEHVPPVVVATAAGLALGVVVGWVVLPGLGLAAFTGSRTDPALAVDVAQLLALVAGLLVVVAIGVVLSAWAQRRVDPARAVREGID